MKKLFYVGTDDWDRPVYMDNDGKFWKDVNLGKRTPYLHKSADNTFDGEPDYPINCEYTIVSNDLINMYKVQMNVKGTYEDALALRKYLAQTVFGGFDMTEENSVSGVTVEIDVPPTEPYVMALCVVELEAGLSVQQISKLVSVLPADVKYQEIEFSAGNSEAIGFIETGFFETYNYDSKFIVYKINAILENVALETPNGIYEMPDGQKFLMSYFND